MSADSRVMLWGRMIGAVSWLDDRELGVFQYAPDFLDSGIELAPLTMLLREFPYEFPALNRDTFKGLPGLLADSLPDRFGNAILDAWLTAKGRSVAGFHPVERLCYMGSRGMGALEFEPATERPTGSREALEVARLVELGRESLAFGTPLGTYAVRQVKSGRRVGGRLNVRDVTGRHCQVVKGVRVESLDGFDEDEEEWREVLLEDRHSTPSEIAACRIDFADWLRLLSCRSRKIATTLATGESTGVTAKRFNVSSGRISQLRQVLKTSWETFQGEAEADLAVA